MKWWPRRAAVVASALLAATSAATAACELVLTEHRSSRLLLTLPMAPPTATIRFTHSVLGTPVADRYEWRSGQEAEWVAYLIEERFEGEGYGLPNAAGPGESLTRDGPGWLLRLNRAVQPLVVPPVQGMRVEVDGQPAVRLLDLSHKSIELRATHCAHP